jgi:hypothetical protein
VKKMDSGYLGSYYMADAPTPFEKRKKSTTPELAAIKTPRIEEESPQVLKDPPKIASSSPKSSVEPSKPAISATPLQVLKFLLSDASLQICHPPSKTIKTSRTTYSQFLTPYEELLCAVILSYPIPHHLGLDTIRTLLNQPYKFCNPVAIKTAGTKKILEAFETARAHHPETSAAEMAGLAEVFSNNEWHNDLSKLRAQHKNMSESAREALRKSIKGLGKGGLDNFYRRVQWQWDGVYPYIDARSQAALQKLGLPRRAEVLERMIEVRWGHVGFEDWSTEFSLEQRRRRAFVVVLERAVGADLEGRMEKVLEEAAKL